MKQKISQTDERTVRGALVDLVKKFSVEFDTEPDPYERLSDISTGPDVDQSMFYYYLEPQADKLLSIISDDRQSLKDIITQLNGICETGCHEITEPQYRFHPETIRQLKEALLSVQ